MTADRQLAARAMELAELERALMAIKPVGSIDGHDVVRRESVRDIVQQRALAAQRAEQAQPTDKDAPEPVRATRSTEETMIRFMCELHSNVPEVDRPMARSDFSDEQWARVKAAFATLPEQAQGDSLSQLDWNRLKSGDRRALDPENQWAFDKLQAQVAEPVAWRTRHHSMAWRIRHESSKRWVFSEQEPTPIQGWVIEPLYAHAQPQAAPSDGARLWLWRNGDHFLAFEHEYPCYSPGGDPMTLGEPAAQAIFRTSSNRHAQEPK